MARTASSYGRGKPKFKEIPTVLVVCEDKKSSKKYIEDAADYYRVNVDVSVEHCGKTDPKNIVLYAISQAKKYDIVFCVIDRDTHANFDEAVQLVQSQKKYRVELIDSHPCFEYWYLLHFNPVTRPYARTGNKSPAENLLKELKSIDVFKDYDKGNSTNIFQLLLGAPYQKALSSSPKLLREAIDRNDLNPSTKVHHLMLHIMELRNLKKID